MSTTGHYGALFGYGNTISGKIGQQDGGAEDVQFLTYGPDSTIRSRSRSDITIYRVDKGLNWINVPGGKLKSCAINAMAGDGYDPQMTVQRFYDQCYDEWAFIGTSSGGVYKDSTVNLTITCPTS